MNVLICVLVSIYINRIPTYTSVKFTKKKDSEICIYVREVTVHTNYILTYVLGNYEKELECVHINII